MLPFLLGLPVPHRDDIGSTTPEVVRAAVEELVWSAKGVEVAGPATLDVVDYSPGSPATASLHRLRGTDRAGAPWSLFCKELQHVRHWASLALMPPAMAQQFADEFPWRSELELWDSAALLPDGLRAPELFRLIDLGDDRLAVWMEDVEVEDRWEVETFSRAASLLGRWNARSSSPEVLADSAYPPGFALRMYAKRSVPLRGVAPLSDGVLWSHPWLSDHGDLRESLQQLSSDLAVDLDRLDTHRQAMPHGDASPQNLLVPRDRSAQFVVIDISFRSPHALGFDLGQLLVGLVHAGQWPAARMAAVADAIVPAYPDGLAAEGITGVDQQVVDAFRTATMLRSGFDSMRYDLLSGPVDDPATRAVFDERLALTRFLVEQRLAR